jgi:uncharacterized membrane protein YqjE
VTKKIQQEAVKAQKEATMWSYLAWTLPFVALAILTVEWFIGSTTWYHYTIIAITAVFFTMSVIWWWWAVRKFVVVMESMKTTDDHFEEVKEDLKVIRKEISSLDDSTR